MLRAYAYWSADERESSGSRSGRPRSRAKAWRASDAEARREAMAAHILDEQEAFYRVRELIVPGH